MATPPMTINARSTTPGAADLSENYIAMELSKHIPKAPSSFGVKAIAK